MVYEVVGSDALLFFFSSSTYSVATVLSTFMLGLAIGSFAMSKVVRKLKDKKKAFAGIQFLIAFYGLFVISRYSLLPEIIKPLYQWGRQ